MKRTNPGIGYVPVIKFILCMVLFQLALLGVPLVSVEAGTPSVQLTDAERSWLDAHPIIRLAPDPEFQPIEFFDRNGIYAGIGADYVRLITNKLGIRFEVVKCANWDDVIARMKRREVDVLNAVVKTPERERYLHFPPPYLTIPSVIIVRKDVTSELTLDRLKGMDVVMVSGYGYVELIRNKHPEMEIELVADLKTALRKVSFGMADAFVGDLATASFYIESEGITNLKLAGESEPPNISGFAVRSDWPELGRILEKGVALLTEEEQKAIHRKWIHLEQAPGLTMREFRNLMLITVMGILVIVSGFLAWNRTLNRVVRQRTKDLLKEVQERKRAEIALQQAHSELEKRVEQRTKDLREEIENRKTLEEELSKEKTFLEAVLNNIEDGIVACNRKGVLTLFNRSSREIHCLPEMPIPADEWADHYELYLADGVTKMGKKDIPLFKALQGENVKNLEMVIAPRKGDKRIFYAAGQPLIDTSHSILGAVISLHDVTEQKKAERMLLQAHQELEKKVEERTLALKRSYDNLEKEIAEREKVETALRQSHKMEAIGTLAGGIAHDFNNILAAILGYADMAKDDIPDYSPARYQIDQVLKAGNRAKDLVRHILTFSRKESQVRIPTEVYTIVKEAIRFLRASIPTTIELKEQIDIHSGNILADETQIQQVIVNICTNAAHELEENGGVIEVNLSPYEYAEGEPENKPGLKPGSYVLLSVTDNGPGIDPEIIDRIFDPYFTTKEVGKGSGMGLAVVLGIIKSHDGTILVDSKPGEGTTVNTFFPKIEEDVQPVTESKESLQTGLEKILIVDDEKIIVGMMKQMVDRLGYQVTVTTSSLEALEWFRSQPNAFDMVISDQTMPGLTGEQLAENLLEIRPNIPIIICTGYSSIMDDQKADQIGISAFIMKPVDRGVLARTIRNVLDSCATGTVN